MLMLYYFRPLLHTFQREIILVDKSLIIAIIQELSNVEIQFSYLLLIILHGIKTVVQVDI